MIAIRFKDVPDALGALNALGSADVIAEYLTELGVRGQRGECERCAVSLFLLRTVEIDQVWVSPYAGIGGGDVTWNWDGTPDEYGMDPLPEHVNEFALRFDHGSYPELIDNI